LALYGKNLLNSVNHGGDTQLPDTYASLAPGGGTFSPLIRGQTLGLEYTFNSF
jgi:iron complex outermembrane receptor protein